MIMLTLSGEDTFRPLPEMWIVTQEDHNLILAIVGIFDKEFLAEQCKIDAGKRNPPGAEYFHVRKMGINEITWPRNYAPEMVPLFLSNRY